jgi:hypothetical protein
METGQLKPCAYFIYACGDSVLSSPIPHIEQLFGSSQKKEKLREYIKLTYEAFIQYMMGDSSIPIAVLVISDIFYTVKEKTFSTDGYAPSRDPQRKEAIFALLDFHDNAVEYNYTYFRENNRIVFQEELVRVREKNQIEGRVGNLFLSPDEIDEAFKKKRSPKS